MWRTLIGAEALAELVERDAAIVVDCRADLADPAAAGRGYRSGHIPGAAYLHLDDDLSGALTGTNGRHPLPDRETFARRMAALGASRTSQIVAYDDAGGAFAARAWWLLCWIGHDAAAVLDGGLRAWTDAGFALDTGPGRQRNAGDLNAAAEPGRSIVGADEIARAIGADALLVIDARSPDRFAGAPHPLDAAAGRIPGARNRFFRDNLGEDGRFKSAATLLDEYRAIIGDRPLDRVVLQCGSGVTAAHDLLAMAHAGLDGARLYPGSWSEWVSDPARPIERG